MIIPHKYRFYLIFHNFIVLLLLLILCHHVSVGENKHLCLGVLRGKENKLIITKSYGLLSIYFSNFKL